MGYTAMALGVLGLVAPTSWAARGLIRTDEDASGLAASVAREMTAAQAQMDQAEEAMDQAEETADRLSALTAPPAEPTEPPAAEDAEAERPEQVPTPPPKPVPKTPLDALAAQGESASSFDIPSDDAWTLYPVGTTRCGTDFKGRVVRLDRPDTDDEFEAEKLKNEKGDIARKYVGAFVTFSGSGDASDGGFTMDGFGVSLGKYNFASHQYPLTISAESSTKWPLSGKSPTIGRESLTTIEDVELGELNGESLTVEREREDSRFINRSSMTVQVKVPTAEAAEMKSNAPTDVVLVMRFTGLGYHKSCHKQCMEFLGIRDCGSDNIGFGEFYRADLVGYRIQVNDKVVAEKQPPAHLVPKE